MAADDLAGHRQQVLRLGPKEAGRADQRFELGRLGLRQGPRRRESGGNSSGVTMLTRASVHCAERIVATRS